MVYVPVAVTVACHMPLDELPLTRLMLPLCGPEYRTLDTPLPLSEAVTLIVLLEPHTPDPGL